MWSFDIGRMVVGNDKQHWTTRYSRSIRKRYRVHSTILCSQFDVAGWHSKLGGGALADAILDRIVSKSQTIKIKGDKSMRSR